MDHALRRREGEAREGGAMNGSGASRPECWINRGRFAHSGVRARMRGAEIRALPTPSIRDDDDLYLEGERGEEDRLVGYDEEVAVDGRTFFSVPRVINAGASKIGTAPSEMATESRANPSPGKSGRPDEGRGTSGACVHG